MDPEQLKKQQQQQQSKPSSLALGLAPLNLPTFELKKLSFRLKNEHQFRYQPIVFALPKFEVSMSKTHHSSNKVEELSDAIVDVRMMKQSQQLKQLSSLSTWLTLSEQKNVLSTSMVTGVMKNVLISTVAIALITTLGPLFMGGTVIAAFTAAASGLGGAATGAGGISAAVMFWLQLLGIDRIAMQRIVMLAKQNFKPIQSVASAHVIPESVRRQLKSLGVSESFYNATTQVLAEKLVLETTSFVQGGAINYALQKGIGATLYTGATVATAVGGLVNRVTSSKDIQSQMIHNQTSLATMATDTSSEILHDLRVQQNQTLQKNSQVVGILQQATSMAATVGLSLYSGQIQNVASTEMYQKMALNLIINGTGISSFVSSYASYLTVEGIGLLKDLEKPLLTSKDAQLTKQFWSLILGETIYSDDMISKMSIEDVQKIIRDQHIKLPAVFLDPQKSKLFGVQQWRDLLLNHQQEVLGMTQKQILLSMTQSLYTSLAPTVIMEIGNQVNTSIAEHALQIEQQAKLESVDITQERINNRKSAKETLLAPKRAEQEMKLQEQARISSVDIVQEKAIKRQEALLEIQRLKQDKAAEKEIRAAQFQQAQTVKINRIAEKYATKYNLDRTLLQGLSSLKELQQLIEQQKLQSLQTTALPTRAIEYGNLREDQIIDSKFKKEFEAIQLTSLYEVGKEQAINFGVASIPGLNWIQSAFNTYNGIVDGVNTSKNVYNVGVALNKLTRMNDVLADNLPYLPTQNLEKLTDPASYLKDYLLNPNNKLNAYDILMSSSIKKITNEWTTTQFVADVALQITGLSGAQNDYDKIYNTLLGVFGDAIK